MAYASHKLKNSFEGALAGGGDPATSPLYVFGPFLRLIVVAGVAHITFGVTVWLAVVTVVVVSAMYRQVMNWVSDGSGGSGLSEEEFGRWAVKVNSAITFIEYTLTFLVSMAALVTFAADRIPALDRSIVGIQYRTLVAIALSLLIGWVINRGPRTAARAFGPATAAVLILLWVMMAATVWRLGFRLPSINLSAFHSSYLHFTLSGYAHILALMTGVEIFANLVAAYDGSPSQKSRKAFGSLMIIMGTTSLTMVIVGPAILQLSDPTNVEVSVFTQTMDRLLPSWLSYTGTIVGVAVLLSACAASAQGVQNLAMGLRYRHYVPAIFGQRNKHDVADRPIWLKVVLVSFCFLVFGTEEHTYLALYAAGVFVLLSMTGWAATKRLTREFRGAASFSRALILSGTILSALLTSIATLIIFRERLTEGVWAYFLFVPALYLIFSYYRKRLGTPTSVEERLGLLIAEKRYLTQFLKDRNGSGIEIRKILIPLNGTAVAESALPMARSLAHAYDASLMLAFTDKTSDDGAEARTYLEQVADLLEADGISAETFIGSEGGAAIEIDRLASDANADLVVMSASRSFQLEQLFSGDVVRRLLELTKTPLLLVHSTDDWRSRRSSFNHLLVSLDGSREAETVLPYVRVIAQKFGSEVLVLSVPEGSESEQFAGTIEQYLKGIVAMLNDEGINARMLVTGSGPARTILSVSEREGTDLIVMATHGRGGTERLAQVLVGSVTARVTQDSELPVLLIPVGTASDSG